MGSETRVFSIEFDENEFEILQNALAVYLKYTQDKREELVTHEDDSSAKEAFAEALEIPVPQDGEDMTMHEVTMDLVNNTYVDATNLRQRLVEISGYDMTYEG